MGYNKKSNTLYYPDFWETEKVYPMEFPHYSWKGSGYMWNSFYFMNYNIESLISGILSSKSDKQIDLRQNQVHITEKQLWQVTRDMKGPFLISRSYLWPSNSQIPQEHTIVFKAKSTKISPSSFPIIQEGSFIPQPTWLTKMFHRDFHYLNHSTNVEIEAEIDHPINSNTIQQIDGHSHLPMSEGEEWSSTERKHPMNRKSQKPVDPKASKD